MRGAQGVEEPILALQRANNWNAQLLFETAGHAGEERVREGNDFGLLVIAQPNDEVVEVAGLATEPAAKHAEREVADIGGPGLAALAEKSEIK